MKSRLWYHRIQHKFISILLVLSDWSFLELISFLSLHEKWEHEKNGDDGWGLYAVAGTGTPSKSKSKVAQAMWHSLRDLSVNQIVRNFF